jgi:hypothetical protein
VGSVSGGLDNQAGNAAGTIDDAGYATVGGGVTNSVSANRSTVTCQGVRLWGETSALSYATLTSTTLRYGNPNISLDQGVLNASDSVITDGITGIEVLNNLGGTMGILRSKIMGNTFGVRNQQPASPFYAKSNWWGDASGPYDSLEIPTA